jgi:hypothetical protein
LVREFRLSPQGVSCDENGAFLAAIPLLKRSHANGKDRWQPIDSEQLSEQISSRFGLPIDMSSKMGGLETIADALNAGNVARAQIATVLLGIPDPPTLLKGARSRDAIIKFVRDLGWSGLIKSDNDGNPANSSDPTVEPKSQGHTARDLAKAGFDPNEPRDERGRWTNENGGSAEPDAAGRRAQLADAGMSDASDDPMAEAAARAAAAARRNSRAAHSPVKPVDSEHEDFWQTLGSRVSHEAQSALSEIGQARLNESNADRAIATTVANATARALRDYANYRAQPWIGADGKPVQVPAIPTGDLYSEEAALLQHELFTPNAPLTRPGTNADWIDPVVDLASLGAAVAGPAVRALGAGATAAADASTLAADTPFIILPPELRADFDITWPIGKYEIPEDLVPGTKAFGDHVHDQVGTLLQDAVGPNVELTLNTAPGVNGVDIEVPEASVFRVGFRRAEIKPMSSSGLSRFKNQVLNVWDLEGQVLPITYDYDGNIYYGFSGPWR